MVGLIGSGFGGASLPAFPLYQSLAKTRDKQFAAFERQPQVQREVDYFLKTAGKVKTVDEFLGDRRLLAFALSAYGMEGEIDYLGRIRKVLSEPVSDSNSLANKLIDPRFKKIAQAFSFGEVGTLKLGLSSFLNEVVDKYKTNEFERYLGNQNPALREAEYFRRNAGSVENGYNILGDTVLRSVVTTALGLPPEIAVQSVEKQKALIEKRLDVKDLQDPEFVDKFLRRFLILSDQASAQAGFGGSTAPNAFALTLLAGAGGRLDFLA